MTQENKSFVSMLETILQIQASAAASRQGSTRRIVEITDEDESVFVSFVPVPTQT
jgi:hypothetical protein